MTIDQAHFHTFWGEAILDTGWTAIPNLLSRNLKKLGITHAEFVLICNILSHKHDVHDPFPSQETLASYQEVTTRQIRKLIDSLKQKGVIRTGRRRNKLTGEYMAGNAFSFKPLLDKLSAIAGQVLHEREFDVEIEWDDELAPQEPEVPVVQEPEVPIKRKIENKKIKKIDREGGSQTNALATSPDLDKEYQLLQCFVEYFYPRKLVNGNLNLLVDAQSIWRYWKTHHPELTIYHIYAVLYSVANSPRSSEYDATSIICKLMTQAPILLVPFKATVMNTVYGFKKKLDIS